MTHAFVTSPEPVSTRLGGSVAVRTEELGVRISGRPVLSGVTMSIAPGECVAILGQNGAGKSTFLRVLATLCLPAEGELEVLGGLRERGCRAQRARIGLVAHQLMLYRDLSALENLELFGRLYCVAHPRRRAMELLGFLGIGDRADDPVRMLSRGMAQRVAIARALVHSPDLLLADEPYSGLDPASAGVLDGCLMSLHAQGRTIVFAHHSPAHARRLAERVIVLHAGRVVLDSPAAELDDQRILAAMEGAA